MTRQHTIGWRLAQKRREKAAREGRDITQADVAKAVGVAAASVSEWEADKKKPRDETLARLAAFLDTTPAYIVYAVPETTKPAEDAGGRDRRAGAVALTPAQIARAEEQAARDEAAASPSVRPARRRGSKGR